MAIVSIDTLKAWLGEKNTENNTALEALELRAEDYLERETGQKVSGAESYTEVRSGQGAFSIFLQSEAVSLTSVETRSSLSSDWSTEDVSDYEATGRRLSRIDGGVFPEGEFNVRIVYTRGSDTARADDVQAVLELCEHWWRNRTRVTDVGIPEGVDGLTPDKLPRTVYQYIMRRRGVPVGF